MVSLSSRIEEGPRLRRLGNIHWGPLVAALLLSIAGIITVHSASAELPIDYLPRQLAFVLVGVVALAVVMRINYHRLVELSPFFYGLGLFLLVLVLIIGREAGGARSWFAIGPFRFQPSEFSKLATALFLTRLLAGIQSPYLNLKQIFKASVVVGMPILLIALESDLGSAAMLVPLLGGVLLVCGIQPKHLVVGALIAMLLAGGLWTFGMQDYQKTRILSFLSPDSDPLGAGYQVRQSKIAVGSGQWLGRGYGQGTQSQLRFLPARHTDFIMAVLAEEWGLMGALTVLGLYGFFVLSAIQIAMRARDRSGILLIVGLLSVFSFHALYNTGMVIGLLPITGIPLPFLSYGGSFTLANFIATGLILNVDYRRYVNR